MDGVHEQATTNRTHRAIKVPKRVYIPHICIMNEIIHTWLSVDVRARALNCEMTR